MSTNKINKKGKMQFTFSLIFICVYGCSAVDIMPELKRNILNFGYGVNFKYKGMLSHSFDRFHVVTKFEKPKVEDLKLTTVQFNSKCSYLTATNDMQLSSYFHKLLAYCQRIVPYVEFYKKQISYYMTHEILTNEIGLILPTYPKDRRHRRSILASILAGIASSVIGLVYENISSFWHHKRNEAVHKAVKVMEKKTALQGNKIHHLEDTMIKYGIYNSDTLTEFIETVHRMHNTTSWRERTFVGKLNQWLELYLHQDGVHHYAINSILFLISIRAKYVKIYERFLEQLKMYAKAIRILSKGYLPISLLPPSELRENSQLSESGTFKN